MPVSNAAHFFFVLSSFGDNSFQTMQSLRIIGVIALIGVILSVVLILSQPMVVHIEKSIFIKGSPQAIQRETESFQSFSAWSPWNKLDPEMHYTIVTFEGFAGTFYSDIKLEPEAGGTKVTWIYDGENSTLKERAMWIFLKRDLNERYDEGLRALKDIVERKSLDSSAPIDSLQRQ